MINKRDRYIPTTIALIVVLFAGVFQTLLEQGKSLWGIQELEWMTYDWRVRISQDENPSYATNRLGAVFIDERSVEVLASGDLQYQAEWPFPRNLHGILCRELKAQGAEVIAFDVLFGETRSVMTLIGGKSPDELFADDIKKAGNVILAATVDDIHPPPLFATNAWAIGEISATADQDGVLRRVVPFVNDPEHGLRWHLGILMAAKPLGLDLSKAKITKREIVIPSRDGNYIIPLDHSGKMLVDWTMDIRHPGLNYTSFSDVLLQSQLRQEKYPFTEPFKGRSVLIGSTMVGKNLSDLGATPIHPQSYLMSTYWNVANSVFQKRFINDISLQAKYLIILCCGLLSAYLSWNLRVLLGTFTVFGAMGIYLYMSQYIFVSHRILVPMVIPLTGAFLANYFCIVTYRVVFEQRERRRVKAVFSKIVSPNVVDALLDAEDIHLGGARRRISVLFTDVRGFTELTDSSQARAEESARKLNLNPRETEKFYDQKAREMLGNINLYLGAIADMVKKHDGTLDKYIGDCVMAFWGAPTPNERHAICAVHAAIEAQRAIYRLNQERSEENARREQENVARAEKGEPLLDKLPLLLLGTGVNTGIVMVGLMGSEQHILNYTVFGREVNLASRLEGVAGRGRIIIGEGTFEDIKRDDPQLAARCIAQSPVMVKGFRGTINTYEVPWKEAEPPSAAPVSTTA